MQPLLELGFGPDQDIFRETHAPQGSIAYITILLSTRSVVGYHTPRSVFWSADGTRLNYVTNTGVRSMSRAGGEATLVLKGDYGDAAPSPDGKALVLWLNKGEKGAKEPKL